MVFLIDEFALTTNRSRIEFWLKKHPVYWFGCYVSAVQIMTGFSSLLYQVKRRRLFMIIIYSMRSGFCKCRLVIYWSHDPLCTIPLLSCCLVCCLYYGSASRHCTLVSSHFNSNSHSRPAMNCSWDRAHPNRNKRRTFCHVSFFEIYIPLVMRQVT